MERTMWTDERLDERFGSLEREMRDGFRRTDEGFREMREGFREMRGEITALRRDMHTTMLAVLAANMAALVAVAVNAF